MIPKLKVLSDKDMERMHEASLELLEKKGVIFQTQEAVELFREHGAKTDKNMVYIPRSMVEWALSAIPSKFTLTAINPEKSVVVGDGLLIHPCGGEVFVDDMKTERWMATWKDFADMQKLYQALDQMDITGYQPVSATDIPLRVRGLYCNYATMLYTDKPWLAPMDFPSKQQKQECLKMYEIVFGEDFLKDHYVTWHLSSPESPLIFPPHACDGIIEFARKNQPVGLSCSPMSGLTGPISMYGNMLLTVTETLAAICLSQLAKEGVPVIPSASLTYCNMKYTTWECACPDTALMTSGIIQMMGSYYHLPTRAQTGVTSSKMVDYQAGYETMQSFLFNALSGVNVTSQTMGSLDNLMSVSLEKTVIDNEIVARVRRMLSGIPVDEESLAVDAIMEVPHGQQYLMHDTTLDHFQECWQPEIADWSQYGTWAKLGKQQIFDKASERAKEILENANEPLLEEGTAKQLKAYIEEIERNNR